jgi:hypothetical protein
VKSSPEHAAIQRKVPTMTPEFAPNVIGSSVGILGNGFSGHSLSTFNGVRANFNVGQDGCLTATVPEGAFRGSVQVVAPKWDFGKPRCFLPSRRP